MKRLTNFFLCLALCFPLTVFAEIPPRLIEDFSPVCGAIIMPVGDRYLVNLDASNNLQEGDILTLIMGGEKIVDSETKRIISTRERPKGFLQVTQIKSGYSYAKLLTKEIVPTKGDPVKRFTQTPTRFSGPSATSQLLEEIKHALPNLHWLQPTNKTEPELIFSLTDKSLDVVDAAGTKLRSYPYKDGKLAISGTGIYHPDNFKLGDSVEGNKSLLDQTVDSIGGVVGFNSKDKRLENPGIIQKQKLNDGIWIGPNLNENPVGLAVGDFDGDGQLELAVALENQLQIYRLTNGKQIPVATVDFSAGIHLLTLDSSDLDQNGIPELYLSANSDSKLSSQVIEYIDGRYKNTFSQIPWFFRSITLPNEGNILIAQTMGEEASKPFESPIFRVRRSDNGLSKGSVISLPSRINLLCLTPFVGKKNDLLYASLNKRDRLVVVTPNGNTIWESAEKFNGSDVYFTNDKKSDSELTEPVYIQQRLVVLPNGDVLAVQNEGLRIFERYKSFDKSRIVAFKWDGFALQQNWSTKDQEGYLADFTVADADNDGQDELVMVIKYKQKNLLQKGRSAIVLYELEK